MKDSCKNAQGRSVLSTCDIMGYKLEVGMACPLNKIPSSTGEEIVQYSHLSEESERVRVCVLGRKRE